MPTSAISHMEAAISPIAFRVPALSTLDARPALASPLGDALRDLPWSVKGASPVTIRRIFTLLPITPAGRFSSRCR